MSTDSDLISVADAASLLGVSRWRINQFISQGRLPAKKVGRAYVIERSNLAPLVKRKNGRPPKNIGNKA
jgi:excisionase family DNA binding protein